MNANREFYYNRRKLEHSFQRYGWESELTQTYRFAVLLTWLNNGHSLLDLGCGEGDLYAYLVSQGVNVHYTGMDILPFMINNAKKRFPDLRWISGSLDSSCLKNMYFDIIYASGVFNLAVKDNYALVIHTINLALQHADAFVVNLLSDRSKSTEKDFFYYSRRKITALLQDYYSECLDNYLPNDMTFYIRKK